MKLLGIIAEYNPFHNGHAYLLEEAKRISGADACVVAMSGDFVQRGEPAIMDKWKRAEAALNNGADIVIEIPTAFVLADAGRYGRAGVKLLIGIGCDAIAFGSESGDISVIKRVASRLDSCENEIASKVSELMKQGLSYPAARQAAYEDIITSDGEVSYTEEELAKDIKALSSPNDILAIEYVRAAKDMEVYSVKRVGVGYSSLIEDGAKYQSASGLRAAIRQGRDVSKYVPPESNEAILSSKLRLDERRNRFFNIIKYALLEKSISSIENSPSGGEGLAMRLKSAVMSAESLDELIEFTKSKRYTYTRISRLLAQIVLGIEREDADGEAGYARILGFNQTGRAALSDIKRNEKNTIPIITNMNKEGAELGEYDKRLIELDELAVNIYNLLGDKSLYSNADRVKKPIIIQK